MPGILVTQEAGAGGSQVQVGLEVSLVIDHLSSMYQVLGLNQDDGEKRGSPDSLVRL